MVVAWRTPGVVFPVEHFSSGRSKLHSVAAKLEEFVGGRAIAIAVGFVGWIYPAVFLADVWFADGILQFRSVASHRHAAGNRARQSGGAGPALARPHASGTCGGGSGDCGGADRHVMDFRKGAGARRYLLTLERARK